VFVFISHLTVPVEDQAELERHFRERSRLVDEHPGFLYLQLVKPQAGPSTHVFLTAWEDRDAFRRYMRSSAHEISHGREPGEIMARTDVRHEAFEVLMDSREAPEWIAAEFRTPGRRGTGPSAHPGASSW
jgi:heme-degrading monooxygenase HmoA